MGIAYLYNLFHWSQALTVQRRKTIMHFSLSVTHFLTLFQSFQFVVPGYLFPLQSLSLLLILAIICLSPILLSVIVANGKECNPISRNGEVNIELYYLLIY